MHSLPENVDTALHADAQTGTSPARRHTGYLLIEVMIALAIGAVAMTGLISASIKAGRIISAAHQQSEINLATKSILSELEIHLTGNGLNDLTLQFAADASESVRRQDGLQSNLQHLIDQLAESHFALEADIDCHGNRVRLCEVCFNWYEHGSSVPDRPPLPSRTPLNRNACQTEIV